jgi:hypothetical protein
MDATGTRPRPACDGVHQRAPGAGPGSNRATTDRRRQAHHRPRDRGPHHRGQANQRPSGSGTSADGHRSAGR